MAEGFVGVEHLGEVEVEGAGAGGVGEGGEVLLEHVGKQRSEGIEVAVGEGFSAVGVSDEIDVRENVAGEEGQSAGGGFGEDNGEAFFVAGVEEEAGVGEEPEFVVAGAEAGEGDAVGDAQRACEGVILLGVFASADHDVLEVKAVVEVLAAGDGADGEVRTFDVAEAGDLEGELARGEIEFGSDGGACVACLFKLGPPVGEVGGVVDDGDRGGGGGDDFGGALGEDAGYGDDVIGAFVARATEAFDAHFAFLVEVFVEVVAVGDHEGGEFQSSFEERGGIAQWIAVVDDDDIEPMAPPGPDQGPGEKLREQVLPWRTPEKMDGIGKLRHGVGRAHFLGDNADFVAAIDHSAGEDITPDFHAAHGRKKRWGEDADVHGPQEGA